MKKTISAALLAAVLCGAAVSYAGPHDSCTAAMKDSSHHNKMFTDLNLTADQKVKMKALREEMQAMRKANMEKMKALREKSKAELLKAKPDKTVLYGIAKEKGDQNKAMSEQMADHMLKVKAVLTKEQFEKMLSRDFIKGKPGQCTGKCPKTGKPCDHGPGGPHGPHDMDD